MPNETPEKRTSDAQNKDTAVKPEPETLQTTDPQENMEGPVSSLMQKITHSDDNAESKEAADEKKERHA